jgi:hypothetical protein
MRIVDRLPARAGSGSRRGLRAGRCCPLVRKGAREPAHHGAIGSTNPNQLAGAVDWGSDATVVSNLT